MKLEKNGAANAARLAAKAVKIKEQTIHTNPDGRLPKDNFTRRDGLPNQPDLYHTGQIIPPRTTSICNITLNCPQLPRLPSGFANVDFSQKANLKLHEDTRCTIFFINLEKRLIQ